MQVTYKFEGTHGTDPFSLASTQSSSLCSLCLRQASLQVQCWIPWAKESLKCFTTQFETVFSHSLSDIFPTPQKSWGCGVHSEPLHDRGRTVSPFLGCWSTHRGHFVCGNLPRHWISFHLCEELLCGHCLSNPQGGAFDFITLCSFIRAFRKVSLQQPSHFSTHQTMKYFLLLKCPAHDQGVDSFRAGFLSRCLDKLLRTAAALAGASVNRLTVPYAEGLPIFNIFNKGRADLPTVPGSARFFPWSPSTPPPSLAKPHFLYDSSTHSGPLTPPRPLSNTRTYTPCFKSCASVYGETR